MNWNGQMVKGRVLNGKNNSKNGGENKTTVGRGYLETSPQRIRVSCRCYEEPHYEVHD